MGGLFLLIYFSSQSQSDPLVVSTLDGTLHAVAPETGRVLWTVQDDPVLRMPSEAWGRGQGEAEGEAEAGADANANGRGSGPGQRRHTTSLLPNPKDGSLYVVSNRDGAGESIRRLPFTIPELVSASPTRTSDGILYMGKKVDRCLTFVEVFIFCIFIIHVEKDQTV